MVHMVTVFTSFYCLGLLCDLSMVPHGIKMVSKTVGINSDVQIYFRAPITVTEFCTCAMTKYDVRLSGLLVCIPGLKSTTYLAQWHKSWLIACFIFDTFKLGQNWFSTTHYSLCISRTKWINWILLVGL